MISKQFRLFAGSALVIAALAFGATGFSAQSASANEDCAGTWRLISIYEENEGAREINQFGAAPEGLFMADRKGNFSLLIGSGGGRTVSSDPQLISRDMRRGVALPAITYFGTYSVDEVTKVITLKISFCSFTGCNKTERKADLKITGNTMKLVSILEGSLTGAYYSSTLWKRECCE